MTDITINVPTVAVPIFYPRGALPLEEICKRGGTITDVAGGWLVIYAT